MHFVHIRVVCVLLVLVLVLSCGCITPPKANSTRQVQGNITQPGTGGLSGTPTPEIIETRFLTPATPYPTQIIQTETTRSGPLLDPTPLPNEYQVIYYNIIDFRYNTTAYSYELVNPPMIIEFCINPDLVTRRIWYQSRYGDRGEETVQVTTISPSSWFEITVRDQHTGEVIAKEGFAKTYSVDMKKALTLRSADAYLIEFRGNDLTAEIQMRIPRTGNTTAAPAHSLSCSGLTT